MVEVMDRRVGVCVKLSMGTASGLLMLAAATAASAQQGSNGGTIALDPVVVSGGTGTSPVTGYVAKKTTAGSKTDTPIEKVPQSVTVIGRDQLEARQPQKLDEVFYYTAGVTGAPYGYDPRTNWVFIRGFDASQTGIFLDGLPLYQYAFGSFYVDPYALERVEVLRGPSSVLYGGGNLGGILNLVSKRPSDEPLRRIEAGINSWGQATTGFDFGGKLDEAGVWTYRLTGRIAGGGYETDKARGFQGFIAPALTYTPNDATSLTLLANYTNMDLDHTGGFLPYYGTVKATRFGRISRDFYSSEPSDDLYRRSQAMIGYQFKHDFNDAWTFRQNVRYAYLDTRERYAYPYGYEVPGSSTPWVPSPVPVSDDNQLHRLGFAHHTTVNTFSADNQLEGRFDTGPLAHDLLFGLDYKYYAINQMQGTFTTTPLSATDPVYGTPQGGVVTPYLRQKYTMHQLGAYLQDQISFADNWLLTLNGRYDRVWTDSTASVGNANFNGVEGAFSGRAGLSYAFANGITPYVSVSRGFNPVIGSNFAGQPFKSETGVQYEAGVKYRPTFFDGLITAAYYDLTKQNVVTPDTEHLGFSNQLGEVRSRGLEVEVQANVTDALKMTAAFTASQIRIKKDTDPTVVGKRPNVVPETTASLWADYTFQDGVLQNLGLQGGIRYIGSSYADNQNVYKVPAATLVDLGMHYKYKAWDFALNVNNVFNKRYVAGCSGIYGCNYGAGRVATLKASYTW
ncbi:TonB-dependent siderophore receptor [Labrys portucalensis]|uniref:TonB-dependent siderophore receptor n=1 Tax=Labrys neptuniae TaxID=376174 RepID=A0ABV6ZK23_9HYPH